MRGPRGWSPARKGFRICLDGLKCFSHLGLRSFYKPCSRKFGLNVWASVLIQQYGSMSGWDTGKKIIKKSLATRY